jgi:hypothetical protein
MVSGYLLAGKIASTLLHKSSRKETAGEEEEDTQRNSRRGLAAGRGFGAADLTAGPEIVRLPSDVAHRVQTNSYSSPAGSTSSSRSRTGCALLHFGQ